MTPATQHPQRCETCEKRPCNPLLGEETIQGMFDCFSSLVGCASHSAQQRIEQVIAELEIEIRRCESINGATIDPEGRAFWRGCIAQAKDTIALLQAEVPNIVERVEKDADVLKAAIIKMKLENDPQWRKVQKQAGGESP